MYLNTNNLLINFFCFSLYYFQQENVKENIFLLQDSNLMTDIWNTQADVVSVESEDQMFHLKPQSAGNACPGLLSK